VEREEENGNVVGSAIKLLLILGQRRTETLSMRFEDIKQEQTGWWWTIPPERTKNARAHRVPLTELALDVVNHRRDRGEAVWVFPSDRATARGHLANPGHALARLRDACRSLPRFTLHDMRRTVATGMAEAGIRVSDIAAVLNHTSRSEGPRVTGAYNRYAYDREKRVALETWERRLRAIVAGETQAAVVPITAARP
jgi:integrase